MVRRLAIALIAVFGVVVGAAAMVDLQARHRLIGLAASDLNGSAQRLAENYLQQRRFCRSNRVRNDLDTLADAFAVVEGLGVGWPQRLVESLWVRGAMLVGLAMPDLSIGTHQIRISTALAAARWASSSRDSNSLHVEVNEALVVNGLLSRCVTRDLARITLEMYASQSNTEIAPLDRAGVVRLAAIYNGQETVADGEAAVAHFVYRELVYQVYQNLRFHRIAQTRAN